jgi:hypothetical protein
MTFEDSTVFEPATPKGAAPKKTKPKQLTLPAVEPVEEPPKQRRKRSPNKVRTVESYDDLRQIITMMKGLPRARRKIALNMLSIMFD